MNFRKANYNDIDGINKIYEDASKSLAENEIDQWQGKLRPKIKNKEAIKNIYLLTESEEILSTGIILDYDKDYANIYDGSWLSNGKYYVVHKFATNIKIRRKGYGSIFLQEVEKLAIKNFIFSIKIDTHEDNYLMQKLLVKNGYKKCGMVILEGSGKRLAYEKLLK